MFDLDEANKVEDFSVTHKGKLYTYDTIVLTQQLARANKQLIDDKKAGDSEASRDVARHVFGIDSLTTHEAILLSQAFDKHVESFEELLKNVFGSSLNAPTTTISVDETTKASQTNNDMDSNSASEESKLSEQPSLQVA